MSFSPKIVPLREITNSHRASPVGESMHRSGAQVRANTTAVWRSQVREPTTAQTTTGSPLHVGLRGSVSAATLRTDALGWETGGGCHV